MTARTTVLLTLISLAAVRPAGAQDSPTIAELYGSGVHAYFSNDSNTAFHLLSQAIQSGTKDPRVYYFRSMALMRMGRRNEAIHDLDVGASLEVQDADGYYPVDRSIERIQGSERLLLERHRREARFAALQATQTANQQRYEETERTESRVLRKRFEFGTEDLRSVQPAGAALPPTEAATPPLPEQLDPSERAVRNAPPVDIPALEPADAADEFTPDPTPDLPVEGADAAAADNPFGGASGDTAEPPAESAIPDAEEADPFGESAPDATTEPPVEESDSIPADSDDPFGGEADDPFGETPVEEMPEEDVSEPADDEGDNPFSAAEPSAPAEASAVAESGEAEPPADSGKIKAGKLAGILGRAIGAAVPDIPTPPALPVGGPAGGPPPTAGPGGEPGGPPAGFGGDDEGFGPVEEDPFGAESGGEFGDESGPVEESDAADPFGDDAGDGGFGDEEMEDDPFADDPSDSDPFGEPVEEADNADPDGDPSPADDPFGN